ncbi:MAG: metallophosphoesterase [Vulcanimicrobiaceae bacterium]
MMGSDERGECVERNPDHTRALHDDYLSSLKLTRRGLLGVIALGTLGVVGCGGGSSTPAVGPPNSPSRTGLLITDIHFNPLFDKTLGSRLAQAPASQWDSIFARSTQTQYSYTYLGFPGDTNFPLLQSALAAMRQQVPHPDIVFVAGDFLAHALPISAKLAGISAANYPTFVNTTEQYLALKLSQTFPNAQIIPTLGDWDTPCSAGGSSKMGSNTYPGAGFLASFSSAWNAAVNRYGGAPAFQTTFNTGGYYSTTFPIDPRGRLIVLNTPPWTPGYNQNGTYANPTLGNDELTWLAAQLADARNQGQRVWILGHVPPGVPGGNPTVPFYADTNPDYATPLYALLTQYRDLLTFGIFGHEHMDDYRVLLDSSSSPIFGMKIVPSVTPFDGNNPAFVQFEYDPTAGVISDAQTWILTNLATLTSASTVASGTWELEYHFDSTYGQHAMDSDGVAGAVTEILTQPSTQENFAGYFYSSSKTHSIAANSPAFLPYGCALNQLTASDYSACYSGASTSPSPSPSPGL